MTFRLQFVSTKLSPEGTPYRWHNDYGTREEAERWKADAEKRWPDATVTIEEDRMAKKKTEAGKTTEARRYEKSLAIQLTETELVERATVMSRTLDDIDRLEGEKKAAVDSYKSKLELAEQEARRLGRIIKDKKEYRPIECAEYREEERHEVYVVRLDTGEEIERRAMTQFERQESLPIDKNANGKVSKEPTVSA